mmetsp:Transcript_96997/g.283500  ORF Transcript_96997/g.283500 Transcript_96997/m.283500 type:complete len:85 (-) Transcript_96997:20-274(-)
MSTWQDIRISSQCAQILSCQTANRGRGASHSASFALNACGSCTRGLFWALCLKADDDVDRHLYRHWNSFICLRGIGHSPPGSQP